MVKQGAIKKNVKKTRRDISAPVNAVVLDKHNTPSQLLEEKVPRSIVARGNKLYGPVKELVRDLRKLMEPYTAVNLRERSYNRLKDYVSIAGLLDVSHIMTVSQTDNHNVVLKIARYPTGPTLHFKVEKYSLAGQVKALQKRPYDSSKTFLTPAVVVLNNFGQSSDHQAQVMKAMFQNMLPSINLKTIKLSDCRRVALFHYKKEEGVVELRHYAIRATPVGISRSVKKIVQGKVPDLGSVEDVSDFVGHGLGVVSDSEAEDEESRVVLADNFRGRGNNKAQQSALKLSEIGPRLTLELFKVESGVGEGDILFHKYVQKTAAEAAALKTRIEAQKRLKEDRRKTQDDNVKRKRDAEEEKKRLKFERKRQKYEASGSKEADDKAEDDEEVDDGGYDGEEADEDNDEDDEAIDD